MEEYLEAFEDAINGKKPFFKSGLEKQVVGLIAKYKLLEEEKKTTDKDKEYLFNELRKHEKQIPELQQHKEFLKFLSKYAPNELEKVKLVAKQRESLSRQPTKKKFNTFIKY